jgi:glycosyltransferase involved in cell wall biosynthesis
MLRSLGHRVTIGADVGAADVLIALHARRSATVISQFRAHYPERPLIVALTGTDLYRDLARSRRAAHSLELAERLIVLQPAALSALPTPHRRKARVIYQSAVAPAQVIRSFKSSFSILRRSRVERKKFEHAKPDPAMLSVSKPERRVFQRSGRAPSRRIFNVSVLSHLRPVKDPMRAALAARLVPRESRIRILHVGRALTPSMASRARAEEARNPRYRWLRERSHAQALALLARSRLLVLSSKLEGGANVIGEAAVCGVPVLASRIDGSIGLLGEDYPGFFTVGDTRALAQLLYRAETDESYYEELKRRIVRIAPLFDPRRERMAWRKLLAELA